MLNIIFTISLMVGMFIGLLVYYIDEHIIRKLRKVIKDKKVNNNVREMTQEEYDALKANNWIE